MLRYVLVGINKRGTKEYLDNGLRCCVVQQDTTRCWRAARWPVETTAGEARMCLLHARNAVRLRVMTIFEDGLNVEGAERRNEY